MYHDRYSMVEPNNMYTKTGWCGLFHWQIGVNVTGRDTIQILERTKRLHKRSK